MNDDRSKRKPAGRPARTGAKPGGFAKGKPSGFSKSKPGASSSRPGKPGAKRGDSSAGPERKGSFSRPKRTDGKPGSFVKRDRPERPARPTDKPKSPEKREPKLTPSGNVTRTWRYERDGVEAEMAAAAAAAAAASADAKQEAAEKAFVEEAVPAENEPVATETPKKPGRVLWLKGKGPEGKPVVAAPPPNLENHRVTPKLPDEELEAIESRITGEFQRRMAEKKRDTLPRRERPFGPAPKADTTTEKEADKTDSPPEIPIEAIYTIGLDRSPLQRFIQRLVDAGIRMVIDIRTSDVMIAPGLTKARDLAILLKEAAGIEYRQEEVLVPRRDIWLQYTLDHNWTRFTQSYYRQLNKMRATAVISRSLFAKTPVALIGESHDPQHDYRTLAAEYLKEKWDVTSVVAL